MILNNCITSLHHLLTAEGNLLVATAFSSVTANIFKYFRLIS